MILGDFRDPNGNAEVKMIATENDVRKLGFDNI